MSRSAHINIVLLGSRHNVVVVAVFGPMDLLHEEAPVPAGARTEVSGNYRSVRVFDGDQLQLVDDPLCMSPESCPMYVAKANSIWLYTALRHTKQGRLWSAKANIIHIEPPAYT